MNQGPFADAVQRFPRVRQSLLSTFDSCALSSRFQVDYEQGWSSHPAARGTIVHRTLARCIRMMVDNREAYVPVDMALAELDDVIRQADVETDEPFGDEIVSIPLREIAEARVTVKTWALYTSYPWEEIAGIEKRLETTVTYPDGDGGLVERALTGKLDLLLIEKNGEHARVVDFKDTWGIPTEKLGISRVSDDTSNVSEEGYFQQRFYGLLVLRHYARVQRVTLEETYPRYMSGAVRDRQGRPINPIRKATIDRSQLGDIEAEMSALVERFDRAHHTSKFRPAPGSHCSYCTRKEACTIFPSARNEGRIATPAEAERMAARLQVLKSLSREATGALRAWSNAHGDVPVKDAKRPRVYGPVVRQESVKPSPEQVRAAIKRGQDPADLFTTRDVVEFCVHSPEEQHPQVAAARAEEEALLAMERAAEARRVAAS